MLRVGTGGGGGGGYKWLSVGLEYTSVFIKPSTKYRVTSKTLRRLSEKTNSNLMVA